MVKSKKDINWDEVSNALLRIVSHRFICHVSKTEWGGSVLVMEKFGNGFARTYWFNDNSNTIYFDWLSVVENERGNGIATELVNTHIKLANQFKIESRLWVIKNTWMYDWYKRKGYSEYKVYENENNAIWMRQFF